MFEKDLMDFQKDDNLNIAKPSEFEKSDSESEEDESEENKNWNTRLRPRKRNNKRVTFSKEKTVKENSDNPQE